MFPIILHELPIKCERDISSVTCGNYAVRLEALSHRTYTKICKTRIAKNYISPHATCCHENNMQRVCKVYQETDLQNKKIGLEHSLLHLQTHLCNHYVIIYDLEKRKLTAITPLPRLKQNFTNKETDPFPRCICCRHANT